MYTNRIITIAETRAGNNETESERRFLEGIEGQGGAIGPLHAKPGRAHHATALQEQRRGGQEKTDPRGLTQACTRPGRGLAPHGTALARLARADSIDREEDGVGVCSGMFMICVLVYSSCVMLISYLAMYSLLSLYVIFRLVYNLHLMYMLSWLRSFTLISCS
jgi:hypothetical protein